MAAIIYGVPLSQPVRAVLWPCLIKRTPFTFKMVVPGMAGKTGTRGAEFRAKFPLGTVPALEDGDVTISESGAIMAYLAEKHAWHDLYPSDAVQRARVHEYLAWSHGNTRDASRKVFGPHVRVDARPTAPAWLDAGLDSVRAAAATIDSYWLQRTPFLAGQAPTIADFSAYEELAQLGPRFGAALDYAPYGNLQRWLDTMASLPHHDAVHASLTELGPLDSLLALDAKQLGAKLGAATKAGADGLKRALAENDKSLLV